MPIQGGVYPNRIDGEWTTDGVATRSHYTNLNPARIDERGGHVPESGAGVVDRACKAASRDFEPWRRVSADVKAKALLHLAELMLAERDALCALVTREMGKTLFDARLDVDEAVGVIQCVAPMALNLRGVTYQQILGGLAMESRPSPRGVAAIITPFNFPVAIPVAQIVSALVTGNTVVWKPSHLVPETSERLVELIVSCFEWVTAVTGQAIPPATLQLVHGDAVTGDALIRHPDVMALSFTGSKAVGDKVDSIASGLGKRVMRECGGINFLYVHGSADLGRATRNILYGKTITSGQRCTSIQRVLADASVYDALAARIRSGALEGVTIGDGASAELAQADAAPDRFSLPPLVSDEQLGKVRALVDAALAQGCKELVRVDVPASMAGQGYYHPFVVLEDSPGHNALRDTEVFGPVLLLSRVSGLSEAVQIINSTVGIVASVDADDKNVSETFLDRVLRNRIDDGRHGTGCFWSTKFGGDRGAGGGNPALDSEMVQGWVMWKTIYRAYKDVL
jgi:aldehyde dehydrogenase (NAD+)